MPNVLVVFIVNEAPVFITISLQTAPLVLLQNEQSIKNNNKLDTSFIDVNINKIYEKDIKISDNKKIPEDQEIEELLKKFLDN